VAAPARRRRGRRTLLARLRQDFLAGLAILLPLVITLWVLNILFGLVHGVSTPSILRVLRLLRVPLVDDPAFARYIVPIVGLFATLFVILLVGMFAANFLGRRIVAGFDRLMLRIPVIKGIYGAARQLLDAFRTTSTTFRRVVAVEYPRAGVLTVGFVAREGARFRAADPGERPRMEGYTLVFLPTTPNPTSGWLAAFPDDKVIPLDLTVEEGIKMIVSGGIVVPAGWEGE
jgi:uncharacterized membrane protein